MRNLLLPVLLLLAMVSGAQQTGKDCTDESVKNEPGRYFDNHTGKTLKGQHYTSSELAAAKKLLTAIDNVCKKNLVFTGGQAKASFMMNSRRHYNEQYPVTAMYNLGFHKLVCNIQTHKSAIVSEYMGVLRVTTNPKFYPAFQLDSENRAYILKVGSSAFSTPLIDIFNYTCFEDPAIADTINKGTGFFELNNETAGGQGCFLVQHVSGKGAGYWFNGNFVGGLDYVYHHAFITHTDIPFLVPVSRKKFLQDLIVFYEREKPLLLAAMKERLGNARKSVAEMEANKNPYLDNAKKGLQEVEQDDKEIVKILDHKRIYALELLANKGEEWLSQPAAVERDKKTFINYANRRSMGHVYGEFYFKEFYTGNEGLLLYQVNPDYLKKYPATGSKPAMINVMYRYRTRDAFTISVRDSYIKNLDLEGLKKLL